MKRIFIPILVAGIVSSCTPTDSTKNTEDTSLTIETTVDSTLVEVNKELKPIDTDEALVATALMAAPEVSRANSKVIGYNMAGEFVTLKEGDNEFIIIADNPTQKGFSAACYHKSLEPFMARGRALKAEGKTGQEIFDIREVEMKLGELEITPGSTLQIYYGPDTLYDPATSKVEGANRRYVIYMPWSTAASTGLPEVPVASNHPWIMNPGTHRAHIMLSPLPEN